MLPLLLRLRSVNWWRAATVGGAGFIVVLLINLRSKDLDIQQARLVYGHPRIVKVVQTNTVQGPVRIVTRTIETPGRREVVQEETRGPVTTVVSDASTSEPVLAPRMDRWILGPATSWRPSEPVEWSVMAGRSWGNRIDLVGGISQRGRVQGQVMFRF